MTTRTGVVVLSHGTPSSRDEVEPFYTAIRHGRPPSAALLDELQSRYDAIGGISPLTARTDSQVRALAGELAARGGDRYVVQGATKYVTPTIEASIERLVQAGVTEVVGLVLSPLRAPMSTDQYHDRALAALAGRARYLPVWSWWASPGFAPLVAGRVRDAVASSTQDPLVFFSAHSLPLRVAPQGGSYPAELEGAADAVAAAAGLVEHQVCWQSAGRTEDPWLGPDVLEVLAGLDPTSTPSVVLCPIGFVSDHLEVLYDVDVQAKELATARGIELRRTASLNDDEAFVAVLADVVEAAASGGS